MLIEDWKRILSIGYSSMAFYALALLTFGPDVLYWLFYIEINPKAITLLQGCTVLLGVFGRILVQEENNKRLRRAFVGLFVVSSLVLTSVASAHETSCEDWGPAISTEDLTYRLVSKWEGSHMVDGLHTAYLDTIADPPVWTICYGSTKDVLPNMTRTERQCEHLLKEELMRYNSSLKSSLNAATIRFRLTPHREAAYTSFTYNVGVFASGRSTAVRRLNKGDIVGACEALGWWNRAGGRIVRGIVNRRKEEIKYCMRGLV